MDEIDRRVLSFVGAHRFVLSSQVEGHLRTRAVGPSRLARLADRGMLRTLRVLPQDEPLWQITARGLEAIGSRLEPPTFDAARVRADLATVMTWVRAWQGVFGELTRVLSAREAAGVDRTAKASGAAACGFGHRLEGALRYPSVSMTTKLGHRIAVEMLLWPGTAFEAEELFEAYREQVQLDGLLVLIEGGGADIRARSEALMRIAESVGLGDRVVVRGARSGTMVSA